MSIARKLSSIQAGSTAVAAEGVSFDGTNDYLSRASDLTGNADSKTFTFSAWVYKNGTGNECSILASQTSNQYKWVISDIGNSLECTCRNSGGVNVLSFTSTTKVPLKTWVHILVSVDLTNSSNRYVYFNDAAASVTWSTYTDDSIDFTQATGSYVGLFSSNPKHKGRLAHIYLDYTYRDLSNSANRRLFITDDLKPADNQASLSPILYLPMTDADTAGDNAGTGGDFTINGTLDTAQRGPNQWNCVASECTTGDNMVNSGVANQTATHLTFSCTLKSGLTAQIIPLWTDNPSTGENIQFISVLNTGELRVYIYDRTSAQVVNRFSADELLPAGKNVSVQVQIDSATQSGNKIIVNGVEQSVTFTTFISQADYDIRQPWKVGNSTTDAFYGEVWCDTTYIDLSTNNPFWDADANRPKSVRQVIAETGNTPLIAMPIEASNAGLNLGTGGNFTVNSGPFVGARGASEYWARSAANKVSTSVNTNFLSAALSGTATQFTFVLFAKHTGGTPLTEAVTQIGGDSLTSGLNFHTNSGRAARILYQGTDLTLSGVLVEDVHVPVFVSWDGTNLYARSGSVVSTGTNSTVLDIGSFTTYIFQSHYNYDFEGEIGFYYFSTDYVDFSVEANRNMFVDQLGYPKDLTPAIEAGDIPTPLIYMKFDDPDALGTNSGTGGDFTVNGTVVSGSDVDPNA